jgi:predicted lipoprotein with Yx(FWY)xxD motif
MKMRYSISLVVVVVSLALVGCAASDQSSVSPLAPGLPQTGASVSATLAVSQQSDLGEFLTDGEGRTLYIFVKDLPDNSTCTDACAQTWRPLTTGSAPVAGSGIDPTLVGVISRADGTTQATYNHFPLYYYANDVAAGDVNGQGVNDAWYVLSPAGKKIE